MSEVLNATPTEIPGRIAYGVLIEKSWASIKSQLPLTAALSFVTGLLYLGITRGTGLFGVFYISTFSGMIINSLLTSGYIACLYRVRRQETFGFEDFFWAFGSLDRFLNLIVMAALTAVLTIVGYVLFVIPGIWLTVVLAFSTVLFVGHKLSAIEAMKASRELVRGHWWYVFGLLIMVGLINALGALCFLIGLLFSLPVSILMLIYAAEALASSKSAPASPSPSEPTSQTPSTFAVNP